MGLPIASILAACVFTAAASTAAAVEVSCSGPRCGCATGPVTPVRSDTLTATFHGVSTLMLDDGHNRILTDGFFSRPGLINTLALPIRSREDAVLDGLGPETPPLRAVLTAHAHHDHALDTLRIADKRPDAIIIGTPAVATLALAGGIPLDRVCAADHGETFDFGEFHITALAVDHGPSPGILEWLLDRELLSVPTGRAWFWNYRDDQNRSWRIRHGGLTILIHPSAGLPTPPGLAADVVFLGMGRVGKMEPSEARAYFTALLGPSVKLVIPVHWDQFTNRPGDPLVEAGWPFDDVSEGFDRLCESVRGRNIRVVKLGRAARISLPGGEVEDPDGGSAALCPH